MVREGVFASNAATHVRDDEIGKLREGLVVQARDDIKLNAGV